MIKEYQVYKPIQYIGDLENDSCTISTFQGTGRAIKYLKVFRGECVVIISGPHPVEIRNELSKTRLYRCFKTHTNKLNGKDIDYYTKDTGLGFFVSIARIEKYLAFDTLLTFKLQVELEQLKHEEKI